MNKFNVATAFAILFGCAISHAMDPNALLFDAIKKNNLEQIQAAFNKGASLESTINNGTTPLHFAANANRVEAMKLLLDKGAAIEAKTNGGATPLHIAAWHNRVEAMRLLLESNASIEAKANNGATPLHVAALNNKVEAIELLLAKGASIEAKAYEAMTPLHIAANYNRVEAMRLLLDRGANSEARNNIGLTSLIMSLNNGNTKIVELLMDYGAYCSGNIISAGPANQALVNNALVNKAQEHRKLIGQSIYNKDIRGLRQLFRDNAYGNQAAQLFLRLMYGELLKAIDADHVEKVKALNTKGLSLALRDDNGNTFAHRAVLKDSPKVLDYLISSGIDPTTVNKSGKTAVHLARAKPHLLTIFFKYLDDKMWEQKPTEGNEPATRKQRLA